MSHKRQFLLGVFFVITLSALAIYTLFWTSTVSLFSDPVVLQVYFPEAIGLRDGDSVQAVGVRIGRVTELKIDFKAPVRERVLATLSLNQELEFTDGASVYIQESTLLGGRHVFIDPGEPGGPPLEMSNGVIYGRIQKNPIAALSEVGDLVSENREAVKSIVENLDTVVAEVRSGRGLIGRILMDDTMGENFSSVVEDVSAVANRLQSGEGLLGALISDAQLLTDARSIVDQLNTVAGDLRAGKGLVGRLIYDDSLANEVQVAIEAFSSVGQRIDRGEGLIGRLVSDQEMSTQIGDIVTNFGELGTDLAAVSAHIRSGEGTIGRLLMDQELYDEALVVVKLLTRSLEDYREAAPVSAFTSVLFSGF